MYPESWRQPGKIITKEQLQQETAYMEHFIFSM